MKRFKLLLVEGNSSIRERVKETLSPLNCEIIESHDGINGIRDALHYFPDMMLANVFLPHLHGVQMMQIIRVLQQHIPSMFISEKSGTQKLVDFFPNVYDSVSADKIEHELLNKVTQLVQAHPRNFTDVEYELEAEEYYGIIGESDKKKILIVTDRDTNKRLAGHLSRTPYYEVYQAKDGQEALFKAVSLQPDLVLAHKELPIIEGTSLARILYILGHPVPIIFLHHTQDQKLLAELSNLKGVRGVWSSQKAVQDREYLLYQMEHTLKLTDEEKDQLENSYKSIDIMNLLPAKKELEEEDELEDPALFGEFDDIDLD